MNRTQASIKNFIWYNVSTLVTLVLNFVLRTILIKTLGEVYVGISNLFTNILGMLSLAELGIGTAIGYNLYRPLAENDRPKIQALINFYRRAYRIVAAVVGVIGVVLIPFLPKIAKGSEGVEHLTFIYCIYIFNTVSSYLIAYKSTIINADQKNYIITNINTATNIIIVIFQMLVLLVFKNYVFYMLVSAGIGFARNIYLNYYTGKLYPFLRKRNNERLSKEEKQGIFPDEIENAGKAAQLLNKLALRRAEGLTTPKQIRFLEGRGFRHVGTWPFDSARKLIDRIAASGWRVPREIVPATYEPEGWKP